MSVASPVKDDVIQEQILLAARQLFQVHGYLKVTMDDVAKAIGKGRSSLYYYYKSKDEILTAVMDAEISGMMNAIAAAVGAATTTEQKIHAFCITKLQVLRERRAFYSTLDIGMDANELSNYNKAKYIIHARIMKLEGTLLNQVLTAGIEANELLPLPQKDLESVIFVLLSSLRGLKREMVIENDFSMIETSVDMLIRMVIHGLKN